MEWDECTFLLCAPEMRKMDWIIAEKCNTKNELESTSTQLIRQCHLQKRYEMKMLGRMKLDCFGVKILKLSDRERGEATALLVRKESMNRIDGCRSELERHRTTRFNKRNIHCNYLTVEHNSNNGESETINFDKRIKILFIRETGKPCVVVVV